VLNRDHVAVKKLTVEVYNDHNVGDKECHRCWTNYPKPCHCGGLIHAEFCDEDYDGDYWLSYKCDKCGDTDPQERE
jgi:hypothetical protein